MDMPLDGPSQRIALAGEVLRSFGILRFRANGGSMLPAIAPGDLLEFHTCPAEEIRLNQVILLQREGGLVAHRVVALGSKALVTRGDALTANDPPWETHEVLGRLVGHQRGHRRMHPGGRHWRRGQQWARWLIRRLPLAHLLFQRIPSLTALVA